MAKLLLSWHCERFVLFPPRIYCLIAGVKESSVPSDQNVSNLLIWSWQKGLTCLGMRLNLAHGTPNGRYYTRRANEIQSNEFRDGHICIPPLRTLLSTVQSAAPLRMVTPCVSSETWPLIRQPDPGHRDQFVYAWAPSHTRWTFTILWGKSFFSAVVYSREINQDTIQCSIPCAWYNMEIGAGGKPLVIYIWPWG